MDEIEGRIDAGEGEVADSERPAPLSDDEPGDSRADDSGPGGGEPAQVRDARGDAGRIEPGEIDRGEAVHDGREAVAVAGDAAGEEIHVEARVSRESGGVLQSAVPSSATATAAPDIPAERGPTKGA